MKVDNINHSVLASRHRLKSVPENGGVGLCGRVIINDNKSVNTGYYSGSSVSFGSAAKFSSRLLDKLLDACNTHTTIVQNLVALVLALGPRPLAIMSLPGKKDKEDKIYASGHSMASGLIGFAFASIIMYPLGVASKKVKEHDAQLIMDRIEKSNDVKLITRRLKKLSTMESIPEDKLSVKSLLDGTSHIEPEFLKQFGAFEEKDGVITKLKSINKEIDFEKVYKDYNLKNFTKEKLMEGTKFVKERFLKNFFEFDDAGKFIKLNKSADFDKVYKALNMAPDVFVFGILKAMLTVALIPPILKHVFGIEKSKPAASQPVNKEGGSK